LNPESYSKASIYHLQGDFDTAEKEYKTWLEKEGTGWKMNGWRYLEFLYRTLGRYEKAEDSALAGLKISEDKNLIGWKRIFFDILAGYDLAAGDFESLLEKADFIWETATENEIPGWQINALWWKIQALLGQNKIEKAVELAEKVKGIVDDTPAKIDIRWYYDDLGIIEMKRKNYAKAIDLFKKVYEMQGGQRTWIQPHAYILYNLASAYYLNDDLDMAKKVFGKIPNLTTGRMRWGDLCVKSYYMLGIIHEKQGDAVVAEKHYEKFLDLWNNADSGIAEVEDAKKRLAGLKTID
jgi:tetratricopeptide (TPR) repeat protein